MTAGYTEFEFDLPGALLTRLINVFDGVTSAPLDRTTVSAVPDQQGVYQLFLKDSQGESLVYVGKTDAEAGLRSRLARHAQKIQHRVGLQPSDVRFKAVRVYVFTAVDLETQLIAHYGRTAPVKWNGSGFGANDPGKERDTTKYKAEHFDTQFPIDLKRPLGFPVQRKDSAANILRKLKASLPYLVRYQIPGKNWRVAHPDLETTQVILSAPAGLNPESVIAQVIGHLPPGWHATQLPSHVIIYKNDIRKFPSGRLIAKS